MEESRGQPTPIEAFLVLHTRCTHQPAILTRGRRSPECKECRKDGYRDARDLRHDLSRLYRSSAVSTESGQGRDAREGESGRSRSPRRLRSKSSDRRRSDQRGEERQGHARVLREGEIQVARRSGRRFGLAGDYRAVEGWAAIGIQLSRTWRSCFCVCGSIAWTITKRPPSKVTS